MYLCGVKGKMKGKHMEAVQFKTEEERMEALRRMVGLRKVFEARVREIMAKQPDLQLV